MHKTKQQNKKPTKKTKKNLDLYNWFEKERKKNFFMEHFTVKKKKKKKKNTFTKYFFM
jgi:hypothetical protein